MKIHLIALLFLTTILRGGAQSPPVVAKPVAIAQPPVITKNFKFKNGIYPTFNDWQHNKPTLTWDSLDANLAVNPKTFLTQVEYAKVKKTQADVPLDSIWGIVIDGIPYIHVSKEEVGKTLHCFAGLTLRGRLSYFSYQAVTRSQVPITAYIPQTGEAYMTKNVTKEERAMHEKLINFETGQIFDLNLNNFKRLIADDKDLVTTVNALKPTELKEKLFKCLLIFNDRNPVYLR